jgi:signal transduction histidine kinase
MVLTLFVSTGRLLRPIDVLTKAANRIASGDQNIVIPTNNNDEIGTLSRAMMRMAEQLRLAGKNSEQSAMGQMASMIAHDLRNALSSVKMNLQILDEHHRKEGDMQIENCEIALGQVRYMETILNDMLTYARPGTAEFDWVDLGDTLRAASVSLLPEITRKSVEVRMEGEEKLPTIMADRNKLLQLFQNVLGNAIYAVPEWGLIIIRTRCLLHESQPSVEIRFEDDGPGISPQIADKVFDPFFTTSSRGTGLGLAIVQRIVAQHGGQVYLDSERDHGTTVVVVLPLTQEGPDDSPESAELS